MSETCVSLEKKDSVAEITLLRGEVLNSFNEQMRAELLGNLYSVVNDNSVRSVLLTGSGRGFCAGQDLAELTAAEKNNTPLAFDRLVESYNEVVRTICTAEKPFVCAVNGVAAGAGANLALACDFVVASEKASFVQAFVNVGLIPDSGGTFFLPRLLGLAKAKELILLGEKVSAEEAFKLGLIYQVAPENLFLEEARKLCARLAAMPTLAIGRAKKALHESLGNNLFQQLNVEKTLQTLSSQSADYREGLHAFIEKRKPTFTGK